MSQLTGAEDRESRLDAVEQQNVAATGEAEGGAVRDDAAQESGEAAAAAVTPEQRGAEEPAEAAGGPMAEQYAETFRVLTPGEIIEGKVVEVGDDEVLVDVGYKSEGRIPRNELGLRPGESPRDILNPGDPIVVHVLKVEDAEGNVLLSRKRALYRQAWKELEEKHARGEPIEAVVTERVKGGLLVDVGVRGFLPASHVDRTYVENLDQYVGQTLRMKIIELDRQRNNVVLSRKEQLEEEYRAAKAHTFATLKEGEIVKGVVRRLADFGAFVDIGSGVEGLLHVSELAWSRVRHPSDVLKEGQEINVKVLNVDRENERISLSLKETLADPWSDIDTRYAVGDLLRGTVTRVVDFGAFVKLEDGVEGLVHISQMADHHVNSPSEIVSPGSEVDVKVVSLDPQARRIGLSIREARRELRAAEREAARDGGTVLETQAIDAPTLGEVDASLSSLYEKIKAEEERQS